MYTFICRQCEQPFERKLRMSQSGETQECHVCGSINTRKSIGAIAIGGNGRLVDTGLSTAPARNHLPEQVVAR